MQPIITAIHWHAAQHYRDTLARSPSLPRYTDTQPIITAVRWHTAHHYRGTLTCSPSLPLYTDAQPIIIVVHWHTAHHYRSTLTQPIIIVVHWHTANHYRGTLTRSPSLPLYTGTQPIITVVHLQKKNLNDGEAIQLIYSYKGTSFMRFPRECARVCVCVWESVCVTCMKASFSLRTSWSRCSSLVAETSLSRSRFMTFSSCSRDASCRRNSCNWPDRSEITRPNRSP